MFINPNDFRKIAEVMTELTDRIIPEEQIQALDESKRKHLLSLRYKWTLGENVIGEIKKELGIREYLDKKQAFIKTKFK